MLASSNVDPLLYEMKVDDLVKRMTASEKRVTALEERLAASDRRIAHLEGVIESRLPHSSTVQRRDARFIRTPSHQPQYTPRHATEQPSQPSYTPYATEQPSQPSHTPYAPEQPSYTPYAPEQPSYNEHSTYTPDYSTYTPEQSTYTPELASNVPHVVPIQQREKTNYMPSSFILKQSLSLPQDVIRKYPKLKAESRAGKLAIKLAKEAYFGDSILAKCTVSGFRGLPALPVAELTELKQTMLAQFPQFWTSPQEFEHTWIQCTEAIGQAAKALRKRGLP